MNSEGTGGAPKGDLTLIEGVGQYLAREVGPAAMVFDEIKSVQIHLDVFHVEPTLRTPYHTLMTSGMAEIGMSLPEGVAREWQHAELMFHPCKTWDSRVGGAGFWAIRLLKITARFPHAKRDWLGPGHSVAWERVEPDIPPYAGAVLFPAAPMGYNPRFDLSDGRLINVYTVMPLFREELEFKVRHEFEEFMDLIRASGMSPRDLAVAGLDRKRLV